jgi:adenylyltransferase/sulfurtransferase
MNNLTPAELKDWLDTGKDFLLVDVREVYEREAYNIGGEHLPMMEVMEHKHELPQDKPVVFYCEKGIRSGIIIQRLEVFGFQNLFNLAGGMSAWKQMQ